MTAVRQKLDQVDVSQLAAEERRRSPWRQRWVDTERGLTDGFRSESGFFVHFFTASLVFCTAMVIGINLFEWAILVLCFSMVLTAELFQCALRRIVKVMAPLGAEQTAQTLTIFRLEDSDENAESETTIDRKPQEVDSVSKLIMELSRIGTAAVMTATFGSFIATTLILGTHALGWLRREELLSWLN